MASRPKFKRNPLDLRINPPKDELPPEEKQCDWAGCVSLGGCKAPKSPDRLREYYNFCQTHARDYNKNWNFFSGMSDADITEWQVGARHGHRPTWDVKKNTGERAQANKKRKTGSTSATSEGYEMFTDGKDEGIGISAPRKRLSKMQLQALTDLGLDETATKDDVRKRYTQLVKQLHPDANKGDRSTEESFARVVKANKVLKSTGLG